MNDNVKLLSVSRTTYYWQLLPSFALEALNLRKTAFALAVQPSALRAFSRNVLEGGALMSVP